MENISSLLLTHGEHYVQAKVSWGRIYLEGGRNTYIINHMELWKPPDLHQFMRRDHKTMSVIENFTRGNLVLIKGT